MSTDRHKKKLLIAIPIFDGLMALDAIGPLDAVEHLPNVEVVFVGYEAGPAYHNCLGTLRLIATKSFDEVLKPDIIIVPGSFDARLLAPDQPVIDWIRKGKIFTSAGVSAGIELGLTLVKVIADEQTPEKNGDFMGEAAQVFRD